MAGTTTTTLAGLQEAVRATLAAATAFSAISVIKDRGASKELIGSALMDVGFCIVVDPPVMGDLRNQTDSQFIMDVSIPVTLMLNPTVNDESGGSGIVMEDAIIAVTQAMLNRTRHRGGERFQAAEVLFHMTDFDEGLWSYLMMFSKEILF